MSRVVGTAVEAVRGAAGGQASGAGPWMAWVVWLCARLAAALAENAELRAARDAALAENAELRAQLAVFGQLLFGRSSERAGHGVRAAEPQPRRRSVPYSSKITLKCKTSDASKSQDPAALESGYGVG